MKYEIYLEERPLKKEAGTFENPIIDSNASEENALLQNPDSKAPEEIIEKQAVLKVKYLSFDNKIHQGQIVVDGRLEKDIKELFEFLLENKFPIGKVIPIADEEFKWSDELSMEANNSSCFNYRNISGTNRLSLHSLGQAIDLNPFLNPYIRGKTIEPEGAAYNPEKPGTIIAGGAVIKFLKEIGWEWGGDWQDRKDYQHFQKNLV